MIFFDSETCGFHGIMVLFQWAEDYGPVQLHNVWTRPVRDTLSLFEKVCDSDVCCFNITFDWFHLSKVYNIFRLIGNINAIPTVEEVLKLERKASDGPCLKPKSALDLMIHARKGPYQATMDRKPIVIRRVPTLLAYELKMELEKRIQFSDIYFAKKRSQERWTIQDIKNSLGEVDPDFKNIVLNFAPTSALKALVKDALKRTDVLLHDEIAIPSQYQVSNEKEYFPFCQFDEFGLPRPGTWPTVIGRHIYHWEHDERAKKYATDDVLYLQELYNFFDKPESGDDDSELAVAVASCRLRGFEFDTPKLKALLEKKKEEQYKTLPSGGRIEIPTSPRQARYYLSAVLDETQQLFFKGSTKKQLLEDIVKNWEKIGFYTEVDGPDGSKIKVKHPVVGRAKDILTARKAKYIENLILKLLEAGKFYASVKVTGTLSNRMSGGQVSEKTGTGKDKGKINPQGIPRTTEVRECFTWNTDPSMITSIGDFSAFEVTLAAAFFGDPGLTQELQSGRSIHGVFGESLYPDMSYQEIMATKGTRSDSPYDLAKNCVFSKIYGGNYLTFVNRYGIPEEIAKEAELRFERRFPGVARARQKIWNDHGSMRQPKGIGTRVEWNEPKDYVEAPSGFRRHFTMENRVCKLLYELANKPPEKWRKLRVQVQRRDRIQVVGGAVQSALYAAAFNIQSHCCRAASNHVIQCWGAQITKKVQRNIWELQPSGIHEWIVQPLNIHDEIVVVQKEGYQHEVERIIQDTVSSMRDKVPLLKMDWKSGIHDWSEK